MLFVYGVSPCNQLPIKSLLTFPRLVTSGQNNRLTVWIKGKEAAIHAPTTRSPQFFHIGKLRAFYLIYIWPPQLWSLISQDFQINSNSHLIFLRQSQEPPFVFCSN